MLERPVAATDRPGLERLVRGLSTAPAHPARSPRGEVSAPPAAATTTGPFPVQPLPHWSAVYLAVLLSADTVAFVLGGLLGRLARFDKLDGHIEGVAYWDVLAAVTPAWLLTMAAAHAYERRYLGIGSEEFRRVANAAARFTALLAMTVFLLRWEVARGMVVVALPTATALTLVFRYLARQGLHHVRRSGAASHRVLVVGDGPAQAVLSHRLRAAAHCGLQVVATCPPVTGPPDAVPRTDHVLAAARAAGADTVAVAHSPTVDADVLRRIAWSLEGTGMNLLVAPALTDVAGPRVNIRPVSGLPLLQVSEPEFTGARRLVKGAIDVAGAALGIALASPLLLALALSVRLSGPGPVLFRQIRIGRGGQEFTMYKFRSMRADAERVLEQLRGSNDHADGVLFKMRDDPRVTPVGRYLRRYSLDELPQLFNVLLGHMSLVGPRPPLPSEVARYEHETHRRLLVKPGMTGLWQVSGRADLDWEETVRLDLYYVENWSVALDAEIAWKTLWAVLRGSGAR